MGVHVPRPPEERDSGIPFGRRSGHLPVLCPPTQAHPTHPRQVSGGIAGRFHDPIDRRRRRVHGPHRPHRRRDGGAGLPDRGRLPSLTTPMGGLVTPSLDLAWRVYLPGAADEPRGWPMGGQRVRRVVPQPVAPLLVGVLDLQWLCTGSDRSLGLACSEPLPSDAQLPCPATSFVLVQCDWWVCSPRPVTSSTTGG